MGALGFCAGSMVLSSLRKTNATIAALAPDVPKVTIRFLGERPAGTRVLIGERVIGPERYDGGKQVNVERSQELIATGAERVATACPFCYIMIDDGVKGLGKDEEVKVADIAMHLLEALEAGEADRTAGMLTTVED